MVIGAPKGCRGELVLGPPLARTGGGEDQVGTDRIECIGSLGSRVQRFRNPRALGAAAGLSMAALLGEIQRGPVVVGACDRLRLGRLARIRWWRRTFRGSAPRHSRRPPVRTPPDDQLVGHLLAAWSLAEHRGFRSGELLVAHLPSTVQLPEILESEARGRAVLRGGEPSAKPHRKKATNYGQDEEAKEVWPDATEEVTRVVVERRRVRRRCRRPSHGWPEAERRPGGGCGQPASRCRTDRSRTDHFFDLDAVFAAALAFSSARL